jgi:YVTN family beta-propeller protein
LGLLLLSVLGPLLQPARAQDWTVAKTIDVGKSPWRAVLTPDGRELYVSNLQDGSVSVIDTATGRPVRPPIEVGESPGTMVASHDGKRVYVLVKDGLAIIDTATKSVVYTNHFVGRTDELALTRDDSRLYMTRVSVGAEGGCNGGVFYLDADDYETNPKLAIRDSGCPIGIAFSSDERQIFVSYQGGGPEVEEYPAHDTVGVYQLPGFQRIAVIKGSEQRPMANVGGQLALSPDGTELWVQGNDACSRPDYPHDGCTTLPGEVVNVVGTSGPNNPGLLKSFGFSIAEMNGRISFSPQGEAFVGGGIYIKEISADNLEAVKHIPIANVGDVAFQPNGQTAYATVTDKNVIAVLVRGQPPGTVVQTNVTSLSLPTVLMTLSTNDNRCGPDGTCYRAPPQEVSSQVGMRGADTLKQCGQPGISSTEFYRCVANAALSSGAPDAVDRALSLEALEETQQYREFTRQEPPPAAVRGGNNAAASQPTPSHAPSVATHNAVNAAQGPDQIITDVTGRLRDPAELEKYLTSVTRQGHPAVALYVNLWGDKSYTVLLTGSGRKTLREDDFDGKPVDKKTLDAKVKEFRALLDNPCAGAGDPQRVAEELYDILIGKRGEPGNLSDALDAIRKLAPQQGLTLVWVLDDDVRYIPMAALYDGDNKMYIAKMYSSVLAAGSSEGSPEVNLVPLVNVPNELTAVFSDTGKTGRIPATILLNHGGRIPGSDEASSEFTRFSLSQGLQQLESGNANHTLIVHIASHFVLGNDDATTFLLLGDGSKLRLSDFDNEENRISFTGIDLVTLSACLTAYKGEREGFPGLAYLTEQGGANAVLASLWEVDDASTSQLMQSFYAGLQKKLWKAEALQSAEVALLDGPAQNFRFRPQAGDNTQGCWTSHKHPRFWAPFVLIGDWH